MSRSANRAASFLLGALASLSLIPLPASAQPDARPVRAGIAPTIAGRVTASETGAPIAGAAVVIVGSTLGAITSEDGRYTIARVPAGEHSSASRCWAASPRPAA